MTSPGNYEYNDDSVVARLSFDVPPQALTDVTQLTQALGAMATQQEYISRSTGTWLEYMQQVPQIMERANQSYREAITQMERMAYIQNEMGGSGPAANVGPSTGAPGGGYNTAAPQGYINPFAGQFFGMGMTPDLTSAQQHMSMMASQSPQLYANFMGARGQAVNPALMGQVGGTVAGMTGMGGMGGTGGGQGWGGAAPGSQSPQGTQSGRDSSAPPDPAQSGQGMKAEPQNIPATPAEGAPPWQEAVASTINGAQQVVNEAKMGGGGRASSMLGLASAGMAAAGKWSSAHPDALGGFAGRLSGVAKGAAGVGATAMGMNLAQNLGEEVQKYTQLGSVQGGGAATGMGYEAQARLLALNPFITTQQARQAMQMALSEGFKGGDFDTIQDYMLDNFKDLGVQFSTSMQLAKTAIYSGEDPGTAAGQSTDLLKMMHALSAQGGAAFPERQQQALDITGQLTSQGMSNESAARSVLGIQEGYSDSKLLQDKIPGSMRGAMGNRNFLAQVAYQNGITGVLPEAIPAALQAKGIDADEAYNEASKKYAYMAQQQYPNNMLNAVASFMSMMNMMGAEMDYNTAEEQYKKVLGMDGKQDPTQRASEQVKKNSTRTASRNENNSPWGVLKGIFTDTFNMSDTGMVSLDKDNVGNVFSNINERIGGLDPYVSRPERQFLAQGRDQAKPPTTPKEAFQGPVRTEGQVSGQVTITVDQNGKVTAPQSIQLSGQQKSANAGYGSAQLNNAPPGDPTFNHSYTGWGGAG